MLLEVGAEVPPHRIDCVSPETMKTWAPILRDPNPIHLDREVVRAKGLGDRLINQGPINVGYCIDMLQAAFPQGLITELVSRFADNVYEGDALTASGVITAIDVTGNQKSVSVNFQLKADERDIVVSGNAVVSLPA